MKSGYFAGNWIRKLRPDPDYNEHVTYIFGDESTNGSIIQDQYLWNPQEAFIPGNGYLVKARPRNFDYSSLITNGGLGVTGAENATLYDTDKFSFNGKIYNMSLPADYKEQVFADDVLFSHTLSGPLNKTVNWVIGNSWTSPISVQALVDSINAHPTIWFETGIYVWPSGSTTYQRYTAPWASASTTPNAPKPITILPDLEAIPSQSIFMIRVLSDAQAAVDAGNGYQQNGTFTLNKKTVLTHKDITHNNLRAASFDFQDEVLFRVSPEANPNIYDLAAVGLRDNASQTFDKQDISKMYLNNSAFLLYSLSTDGQKLSVNAVPPGTKNLPLCFYPGDTENRMTISASRTESIAQVWLEDLLTNTLVDLKEQNNYTFNASPQDSPERFVVHFMNLPTEIENLSGNFLQGYYANNELIIKGLRDDDLNASFFVVDLQGRMMKQMTVTQTPEMHIPLQLSEGIYIAKLQGKRTITIKFRKGGTGL
jgi:hypothetical protein